MLLHNDVSLHFLTQFLFLRIPQIAEKSATFFQDIYDANDYNDDEEESDDEN